MLSGVEAYTYSWVENTTHVVNKNVSMYRFFNAILPKYND